MNIPFGTTWRPQQCRKIGYLSGENIKPHLNGTDYSTRIHPGAIIVWSDRKAYRVVEISERPAGMWPEHFRTEWTQYTEWWVERVVSGRDMGERPDQATWQHRPLVVAIRPADEPNAKVKHYAVRADRPFYVLPEHYGVCRLCNEIPPCTHVTTEAAVGLAMQDTERLMAIQPGCCLGCGEPVTSRMRAVRFPGPNLWRPDMGDNSAVFHARLECSGRVLVYQQQWEQKGHDQVQPELASGEGDAA